MKKTIISIIIIIAGFNASGAANYVGNYSPRKALTMSEAYQKPEVLLEQENLLQQEKIQFQYNLIIAIVLFSVLAIITIFLLFRIYLLKKKSNIKLLNKNDELIRNTRLLEDTLNKLKQSQQKQTTIISAIPDMYFLFDEEYSLIDSNLKTSEKLFVLQEEPMNKSVTEIFPKELADLAYESINKAKVTGELQVFRYKIKKDNKWLELEGRIAPTESGLFLMIARDFTDQSKIISDLKIAREEAEKATDMKSMFLASLSHEIRTPLSSIIGITGVLEETELSEEQREYLNVIIISGNNLLSLINNILDFTKIETGQLQIEKHPFNLRMALEEATTLLKVKAADTNNHLITLVDPDVPDVLTGDVVRLKQILINLINNALKFTKNGSVTIKIQLFDEVEDKLRLKFNVIDTGIGVAVEQRDKLFQAFSQADPSIARKYGGTGLGLAICKLFATMMGGEIGVQSEKDKGSNFWFTIVFNKATEDKKEWEELLPPLTDKKPEEPVDRMNILLVEDNLLNQKFAIAILKKYKHHIDIADNGQIGVELFAKNKYDVILMDIQMPVMDGIEATKNIRKLEKENDLGHIRIVAVTAYAMEGDEERFYRAGIDAYLRKPYRAQQLVDILEG